MDRPRTRGRGAQASSLHLALTAAVAGDVDAWFAVNRGVHATVRRAPWRQSLSPDDMQEIAQETLLRIFQQLGSFRPDGNGTAWVTTIARFEYLSLRKRRGRRNELIDQAVLQRLPASTDVESHVLWRQRLLACRDALSALTKGEHETLELTLSSPTSQPLSTANRKRLERARRKLQVGSLP